LLSNRLQQLRQSICSKEGLSDLKLIEISKGGSSYVINSLTMVYGLFVQQKPDLNTILKACFIGGDTDSNASMLGAMIGVLRGPSIIPKTYVNQLYKSSEIIAFAKQFATQLILNTSPN